MISRRTNEVRPLAAWRSLASRALTHAAVPLASWCGPRANGRFGVLAYHRITPIPSNCPPPTYNVAPEAFRRQLEGLLARGYRPVELREVIGCRRNGNALPQGAFVVTFDDACESVYRYALPILNALGVPATVFVATAYLDSDAAMPQDDWAAAGSPDVPPVTWRTMTTEQCLNAQQSGMIELACHTHTHADFRGRPEAFAEDVRASLAVLRERFGVTFPAMAFPFGVRDAAMIAIARDLGLACCFSTHAQRANLQDDGHDWGRFTAQPFDTAATLSAKLSGWYDFCRGRGRRRAAEPSSTNLAEVHV